MSELVWQTLNTNETSVKDEKDHKLNNKSFWAKLNRRAKVHSRGRHLHNSKMRKFGFQFNFYFVSHQKSISNSFSIFHLFVHKQKRKLFTEWLFPCTFPRLLWPGLNFQIFFSSNSRCSLSTNSMKKFVQLVARVWLVQGLLANFLCLLGQTRKVALFVI